jgi:dCMP deaminase
MYDRKNTRPEWADVWMTMAETIGRRSRCVRAQIGCVLVSTDNQVISASYNGPPPKYKSAMNVHTKCDQWCPRSQGASLDVNYDDCPSSHAEANGVARADWSRLQGGTAYVNGASCMTCAKLLAAAGIRLVVMQVHETDQHRRPDKVIEYLGQCGVEVFVK